MLSCLLYDAGQLCFWGVASELTSNFKRAHHTQYDTLASVLCITILKQQGPDTLAASLHMLLSTQVRHHILHPA